MCHICHRLGFKLELDPPPRGLTDEQVDALDEAFWERARAEEEAAEQRMIELIDQGKGPPGPPPKRPLPPTKVVVEPAPAHDGAPTFAAYRVVLHLLPADPATSDGYSDSPPPPSRRFPHPERLRPEFGLRVYDTTAAATAQRAALLARRIAELTREARCASESHQDDRIEVVVLPLPPGTGHETRAAACIAHNEVERAARLVMSHAAVAASWYLAEDFYDYTTRKTLWVINDLEEDGWEETLRRADRRGDLWNRREGDEEGEHGPHGGHFLEVSYDNVPDEEADEEWAMQGRPPPECFAREYPLRKLGDQLGYFRGGRGNVFNFYQTHFVPEGILEKELAMARAIAAVDAGGEGLTLCGDEDEDFIVAYATSRASAAALRRSLHNIVQDPVASCKVAPAYPYRVPVSCSYNAEG